MSGLGKHFRKRWGTAAVDSRENLEKVLNDLERNPDIHIFSILPSMYDNLTFDEVVIVYYEEKLVDEKE